MSARLSTPLPRACSGDMYAAVPRIRPAAVPVCASVGDCRRLRQVRRRRPARRLCGPGLREPEIEQLDLAVGRDFHVRRLHVAVHDALLVRFLERLGGLPRDRERLVDRDRAPLQPLGEVFSLDELHHQDVRLHAAFKRHLLEAVEVGDPRMIERRQQLRLALEAREPVAVGGERLRQQLEGHLAPELRVGGAVDLAHPTRADRGADPVVREAASAGEGQVGPSLLQPNPSAPRGSPSRPNPPCADHPRGIY